MKQLLFTSLIMSLLCVTSCRKEEVKMRNNIVGEYHIQGTYYKRYPPTHSVIDRKIKILKVDKHKDQVAIDDPVGTNITLTYTDNGIYIFKQYTKGNEGKDTLQLLSDGKISYRSLYYTYDIYDTTLVHYTGMKVE
ncbi:MAG: hypothetical protein ACKVTZ_10640 [Bacteroidia bacterium]